MTEIADDKKLYKIGEVCRIADVQPYVLRYWETEFPALTPNKSGGGQRLYTQREIDTILRIKQLLYSEGFTIAGAKKKLESDGIAGRSLQVGGENAAPTDTAMRKALLDVKRDLLSILAMLDE